MQTNLRFNIVSDPSEPAMARAIEAMFLTSAILATYMDSSVKDAIGEPIVVLPRRIFDWASVRLCAFNGNQVTVLEEMKRRFPEVKCERSTDA